LASVRKPQIQALQVGEALTQTPSPGNEATTFECSANQLDKRGAETKSYAVCSPLCRLFTGSCRGIES